MARRIKDYLRRGKVGEPGTHGNGVVWVEFEAYPEPKALRPEELAAIVSVQGATQEAANHIGASEAFVRQNMR